MKVKILIVLIFTFHTFINLSAQTYLAYNDPKWEFLSAIPESFDEQLIKKVSEHDFGKRVACLKKLVDKYYITKEDVIPGDPMMRTIVLKPNLYYSTHKLEKYLKQRVKDKSMRLADAAKEMEHILEVALSIVDTEDVSSFEVSVKKNKNNIEKQIELFNQVKLYNIYH
ncbi:MAG: hypothetical protein LBL58_12050 [Tannerellaceae bacterium]|jgi:hypothetical protein|nr:hypothetical protein [Tannerellaceae bacterium]